MSLALNDLINSTYSTSRLADQKCNDLLRRLGYKSRNLTARLAIARSLSLPESPSLLSLTEEESASPLRGIQLFGSGADPGAWIALIIQRSGNAELSRRDFQALVSAHWKRGADLLADDWDEASGNLETFIVRLADIANLATEATQTNGLGVGSNHFTPIRPLTDPAIVPVGPHSVDCGNSEKVFFEINATGGSPHMAIMGGTNSGKTYTATTILRSLRRIGNVPIIAFDFKGDLSERLAPDIGARVLSPPRIPVPLDILTVSVSDETGLRETASRIKESIARVKESKLGGVQADILREAILATLRRRSDTFKPTLPDLAKALASEYDKRGRKPDELISTINELTQFELFTPEQTPAEFFNSSWVIRLPQDSTAEVRKLVINLTLDALDRWINSLQDSVVENGRRGIRHLTMLDEAHVILETRLPALDNLMRMSRSKGGVVMLVSQSPDDFEQAEDGFLDNMGLTVAFATQAKPGATRRIFGNSSGLVDLRVGEALCRIRTEAKTRKILAWTP
jgi:DNA sulfur modification protein DndE